MKEAVFQIKETLKKGLAPNYNPRNKPYLVQSLGAYPLDEALISVSQFTPIDTSSLGSLPFPYPQIFVCSEVIIICTPYSIYEYDGSSLILKLDDIPEGLTWNCIDYKLFIYLSNCTVAVTKNPTSGVYAIV
jgi:hypothetical protein